MYKYGTSFNYMVTFGDEGDMFVLFKIEKWGTFHNNILK